jgi:hypothetical protein
VARFLGVDVVIGAADGLRLGRFDVEARQISIAGGYPAEAQAVELAHACVHALTPYCHRQQLDCERDGRGQDWEQVATSAAALVAQRLGWKVDDDIETIWSLSVTEERRQELAPYVDRAFAELSRGIGL